MIPTLGLYITVLIESERDYSRVPSRRIELSTEKLSRTNKSYKFPLLLTMSFISFAD